MTGNAEELKRRVADNEKRGWEVHRTYSEVKGFESPNAPNQLSRRSSLPRGRNFESHGAFKEVVVMRREKENEHEL